MAENTLIELEEYVRYAPAGEFAALTRENVKKLKNSLLKSRGINIDSLAASVTQLSNSTTLHPFWDYFSLFACGSFLADFLKQRL